MAVTERMTVRRAGPDDIALVVDLAGQALGWRSDEPNEELFRWKHLDNPFGPSPMWVAEEHGRAVGFRAFLRWEFERDGQVVRAVRAVDTATLPDAQGRGVFRRLTTEGLDALALEGVGFVFNTPNTKSRPGYLKMGWETVGRPCLTVRPRSAGALVRMVGARTSADKFSLETDVGKAAGSALAPVTAEDLVSLVVRDGRLRTRRTPAFLQWRYGLEVLRYRVLTRGHDLGDGFVVFRLRSRGSAIEAVIADVLVPGGHDRPVEAELLDQVRRRTGADYLLRIDDRRIGPGGFVQLPRQGPVLTWRAVTEWSRPGLHDWGLALGDLELL